MLTFKYMQGAQRWSFDRLTRLLKKLGTVSSVASTLLIGLLSHCVLFTELSARLAGQGLLTLSKGVLALNDVHIRWMIRRDLQEVLDIESRCFRYPWPKEEFLLALGKRNCIGMVAEVRGDVLGFMVYELHKNRLHVLNFAVNPSYPRIGIGRSMVEKLVAKLVYQRRDRILLEVRETNLDAQLFFRSVGFRCVSVLRDFYEDTTEDAYVFEHRCKVEALQEA